MRGDCLQPTGRLPLLGAPQLFGINFGLQRFAFWWSRVNQFRVVLGASRSMGSSYSKSTFSPRGSWNVLNETVVAVTDGRDEFTQFSENADANAVGFRLNDVDTDSSTFSNTVNFEFMQNLYYPAGPSTAGWDTNFLLNVAFGSLVDSAEFFSSPVSSATAVVGELTLIGYDPVLDFTYETKRDLYTDPDVADPVVSANVSMTADKFFPWTDVNGVPLYDINNGGLL